MKNQVQLIAYVNRMSTGGLQEFQELMDGPLNQIFGGIHLLPFFFPYDGEDNGFDPINHQAVDPRLGNWEDIALLGERYDLMADLIVNHISAKSEQFQDYLKHGRASLYAGMFLTMNKVFPVAASESSLLQIYRPRPGLPFTELTRADHQKELFWTTFTPNQIDFDVHHPQGKAYLEGILEKFHQGGIKLIRLDAAGYVIKKAGTSCFMIPETIDFIAELTQKAHQFQMKVLVEMHGHFQQQIDLAHHVDYVYDFALPPLVLDALYHRNGEHIWQWLDIRPNNTITVLDTHDGIGVIDIGPTGTHYETPGLVPNEAIDRLVNRIHQETQGQSLKATGNAAHNLDLYQVNTTYYDALGGNDLLYLMARAIQFFVPGIPQVYYMGFFAEPNDMQLLARTQEGRSINRHFFDRKAIENALQRPVVAKLVALIRFRNAYPAFDGQFEASVYQKNQATLSWHNGQYSANLVLDFESLSFKIQYTHEGVWQALTLV